MPNSVRQAATKRAIREALSFNTSGQELARFFHLQCQIMSAIVTTNFKPHATRWSAETGGARVHNGE